MVGLISEARQGSVRPLPGCPGAANLIRDRFRKSYLHSFIYAIVHNAKHEVSANKPYVMYIKQVTNFLKLALNFWVIDLYRIVFA